LMMRLNRFLALCGLGSRRKCESLIQAGRVAIDGNIVESLGISVNEQTSVVTVDGKRVFPPQKFVYILLNKPKGYVTTANDELGRKTVLDLLPDKVRLFPVGRLDKDTMGVLLLTNDGEFAFQLIHPKFKVDKIYQVSLNKPIHNADVLKLQSGILLEEGVTSPCQVKIVQPDRKKIEIILHEGRKRQIRRMLQSLGYKVADLIRIQFGTIALKNLKPGQWRYLTDQEVANLKKGGAGTNG
jgi:23S rRNA pseudouridine2605 synthase